MTESQTAPNKKPKAGDTVVLLEIPPGFLNDLPLEDQGAITAIVGKPIQLVGYDEDGRAELEFTDTESVIHSIYVDPRYLSGHE